MENKNGEIGLITTGIITLILASILLVFGLIMMDETYTTLPYGSESATQTILSDNNSAQTLTATPTAGTFSATAINQTWLSFDGVNDYVDLNFPVGTGKPMKEDGNYSISLWFNSSNLDQGDLIHTDLYILQGVVVFNQFNKSLVRNYLNSTRIVNISQWINLIIVFNYNGNNASMYLDGFWDNSTEIVETPSGSSFYDLSTSSNSLLGYMDEIRFYNRTLTLTEVSAINSSGRIPNSSLPTTGLVLWLPLNENSGTTVHSFNQSDFGT